MAAYSFEKLKPSADFTDYKRSRQVQEAGAESSATLGMFLLLPPTPAAVSVICEYIFVILLHLT
jgi:hypothetical protein